MSESRLNSDYTAIASDDGAVAAIKSGRVRVVAAIEEFSQAGVLLEGGETVRPDIVIAATGYRTGLGQMLGTLPVLDSKGVPLFNGPQSDPKFPGLWLAGMRPSVRGYFANSCIQAKEMASAISKAL
jgi:cation diffusion facilitator CzcD-associated flavoprotein CzcO